MSVLSIGDIFRNHSDSLTYLSRGQTPSEEAQEFLHIISLCTIDLFCFLVNVNEHHKFTTTTQSHCLEQVRKECKI